MFVQADSDALDEAKNYINHAITEGMTFQHKAFGKGTVLKGDGSNITVYFEKFNDTKALNLAVVIGNGLGSFNDTEITDRIKSYAPILNHEGQIPSALANAVDELQPYLEYLD